MTTRRRDAGTKPRTPAYGKCRMTSRTGGTFHNSQRVSACRIRYGACKGIDHTGGASLGLPMFGHPPQPQTSKQIMSNDYAFWKWRGRARISRGLCYLLVAEGAELPEVELLDIDRYRELIAKRFPSWGADDDFLPISCQLLPTGICLQTYANTPTEVLQWFVDLSEADSLEFFDPQREAISEQDKRDFHARLTAIEQAETAARWQKDINHLLARAEASDRKALVELGNRYSFGEGVQQDLARAFSLYLRAAEAGSADGMFNVAACYRLGDGVEKNLLKAAEWYERALVEDKFFAPFALGLLYSTPGGLPPDNEKAIANFQVALANGHQDARRELRRLGALPPLPPGPPRSKRTNG